MRSIGSIAVRLKQQLIVGWNGVVGNENEELNKTKEQQTCEYDKRKNTVGSLYVCECENPDALICVDAIFFYIYRCISLNRFIYAFHFLSLTKQS